MMDLLESPERVRILQTALDARTLPEIDAATQALRRWTEQHPEDVGIMEAFEGLAMMKEISLEQQSERIAATAKAA